MVLSDLIHGAAREPAGWALIADPTDKERRYCERNGLELVAADCLEILVAESVASC
jgi:hypothetical protein